MNNRWSIAGDERGRSHPTDCESAPTWARPPEPAGAIRRGLVAEAPSILQDGAASADDHDGPIAESRHAVAGKRLRSAVATRLQLVPFQFSMPTVPAAQMSLAEMAAIPWRL